MTPTAWVLVGMLVLTVGAIVWHEVSEWRDLRARQRASAEAWSRWCDTARESLDDIVAGRAPRPFPEWRDPNRNNNG